MRLPTGLLLALSLHAFAAMAADADDWLIARRGDVWKQIGRASCRERVEISVVGVTLKKKRPTAS